VRTTDQDARTTPGTQPRGYRVLTLIAGADEEGDEGGMVFWLL
jgi:hypothetical protein